MYKNSQIQYSILVNNGYYKTNANYDSKKVLTSKYLNKKPTRIY